MLMKRISARANLALQPAIRLRFDVIHARSARAFMLLAVVGVGQIRVLASIFGNKANPSVIVMMMGENREEGQACNGYRYG
jgi:hypothetical protein